MRGFLPDYEAVVARSLDEALQLLSASAADKDPRRRLQPLAGGTDLMVLMAAGKLPAGRYLSLWGLPELGGITVTPSHLELGALTTYTDVRRHALVAAEFPMLSQAAAESGALAIQNRGTLGGNIANASPAADTPPALLAYDAELELVSTQGRRTVRYAEFHLDYKKTRLKPGELIARVRVPRRGGEAPLFHFYRKVGTRRAQAISKVCLSGTAVRAGDRLERVRIGLGSVAPIPLRCPMTEAALTGRALTDAAIAEAQAVLGHEITPIDDVRSSAAYRLRVTQNVLAQFVRAALAGEDGAAAR